MLEGKMISWQIGIGISDAIWQERAAFPGYPTALLPTGKGTVRPGRPLYTKYGICRLLYMIDFTILSYRPQE